MHVTVFVLHVVDVFFVVFFVKVQFNGTGILYLATLYFLCPLYLNQKLISS